MTNEETWAPVTDWPEYEVSDMGRVRRAKASSSPRGRVKIGRILAQYVCSNGYMQVTLARPGGNKKARVHRLVAKAFLGDEPEGGADVNHKNSVRSCNRSCNLEWMTRSENILHGYREGYADVRGDKHPQRVLSAEDVRAIRADHTGKHGQGTALARKYGVAKETIYSILSGRSWASVE